MFGTPPGNHWKHPVVTTGQQLGGAIAAPLERGAERGTLEPLNVRKNDRKFRSTKAANVFFVCFGGGECFFFRVSFKIKFQV